MMPRNTMGERPPAMKDQHPIRRERELRGWSQAKLAELLGTSPLSISQWERRVYFPSPHFRERLCVLFEKRADELGLLPEMRNEKESLYEEETHKPGIIDPLIPLLSPESKTLIGRDGLLCQLVEALCAKPSLSTLTLYGLPGVGKTALLLALTQDRKIRQQFTDGILWAGLGPQPHLFEHLHRWGTLLHMTEEEMKSLHDLSAWGKRLRLHIGTRRFLILLDDVWHVDDALALHIGGEQCVHVVTTRLSNLAMHLSFQKTLHVLELEDGQGIELLARFLPRLAQQEPERLHDLIQKTGTLPLALTLIGKHLSHYDALASPRRLHTALSQLHNFSTRMQLSQPQSLVDHHPSLLPGEQLSLEAIIAVSYQHLHSQEQTALCALAVLPAKPSSFSEEVALAVLDQPIAVLDGLYDASLIEIGVSGRYMVHQTIVDYAKMQCSTEEPIHRLIDYVIVFLTDYQHNYEKLTQENTLLLHGLQLAFLHEKARFVEGVLTFMPFLLTRGWYTVAKELLLQAYQSVPQSHEHHKLSRLLEYLSDLTMKQGEYEQAKNYCVEGLQLARQENMSRSISKFLSILGNIEDARGVHEQADAFFQEALRFARQCDATDQECLILNHLGSLELHRSNYQKAESYYLDALALAKRLQSPERLGLLYACLAALVGRQGNYAQAEVYCLEGLHWARKIGHLEHMSLLLTNLGVASGEQCAYQQAEHYYQEGLAFARQIGHLRRIVGLCSNLGVITILQGRDEQAKNYLQESLDLAQKMDLPQVISDVNYFTAQLEIFQERYENALPYYLKSVELAQQINYRHRLCTLYAMRAKIADYQGDVVGMLVCFAHSLVIAYELGLSWLIAEVLVELANICLRHRLGEVAAIYFEKAQHTMPKENLALLATIQFGLAQVASLQGNVQEASRLGTSSLKLFETMGHRDAPRVRLWLTELQKEERATHKEYKVMAS